MKPLTMNPQTRPAFLVGVLGLVLTASAASAQDGGFKLVVHESNLKQSITRDEVARFFLKQVTSWPAGGAVIPVDQEMESSVRQAFSKALLKRDVRAIKRYWQAQIFSGRAVPAPEKESDAAVLAFVQSTEGSIGYVSSSTRLVNGVKEIKIE
jgi:ABC-type phosphate transport system substrate-binding protein